MILVISSEEDNSTDYFMEWCFYKKIKVLRLNNGELHNIVGKIIFNAGKVDIEFQTCYGNFSISSVKAVWFRRGFIQHYSLLKFSNSIFYNTSVNNFLENECTTLNDFIIEALIEKPHLNNPNLYNVNKLKALKIAGDVGLNIPQTLITKSKVNVAQFLEKKAAIITKPMQDSFQIEIGKHKFQPLLQTITRENIEDISNDFFYSKFQNEIKKKYELRIFFVEQIFFAAAIFYSNNIKLSSNKIVPFLLPDTIREKINEFNLKMNLNSGSIDMIVDKNNNYYFLEVNPVGQYDYVSKNCNYYLDKFLADYFQNFI